MRALPHPDDARSPVLPPRSLPRPAEVGVLLGGEARRVPTGTPVGALLPARVDGAPVVGALLDGKPVSLHTPLYADASVHPLTPQSAEGRRIWARSLGLLLLEAAHEVAPDLVVRLGPSRGPVQLVDLEGPGAPGDPAPLAEALRGAMLRRVREDVAIRVELWALEEAAEHFRAVGWDDAADLLATSRLAAVPVASCGAVHALGLGTFLPTVGTLGDGWKLTPHGRGLVLDYGPVDPRSAGGPHALPDRSVDMAAAHLAWLRGMGVTSAGAFNALCVNDGVAQVIRVAEGFHEKRIGLIADEIAARRGAVRIIAVAGPSASGKTTFIKRLSTQLRVDGIAPLGLSLDDYYVDRERTVRDENGEYDFEALEALDLSLLHEHVRRILAGEAVATARYDFLTGRSKPGAGPRIQLGPSDVLLVEGIHGLNPALLGAVPPEAVYRIFIHPMTTLPYDRLSRTSPTDLRLLRRIVRDRHGRGYRADENILRWPSVERGERKHIFPFQGMADAVFDSALVYEPSVMKVYAERYLLEVPRSSPAYGLAWRLRLLIDRYVSIYPDNVPPTSIVREFIGGSGFQY